MAHLNLLPQEESRALAWSARRHLQRSCCSFTDSHTGNPPVGSAGLRRGRTKRISSSVSPPRPPPPHTHTIDLSITSEQGVCGGPGARVEFGLRTREEDLHGI